MSDSTTAPDPDPTDASVPAETDSAVSESTATPTATPPATTQAAWLMPVIFGGAGLVVGLGLGLGGALIIPSITGAVQAQAADNEQASAVEKAGLLLKSSKAACQADVDVAGDGSSMYIDGEGKDFGSGSASIADIECLLAALNTPASVKQKMYDTRALDGRQDGRWDNYEASWSYHPDDGLDVIIEVVD